MLKDLATLHPHTSASGRCGSFGLFDKSKQTKKEISRQPKPPSFFPGDFVVVKSDSPLKGDIMHVTEALGWQGSPIYSQGYRVEHVFRLGERKDWLSSVIIYENNLREVTSDEREKISEIEAISDKAILLVEEIRFMQKDLCLREQTEDSGLLSHFDRKKFGYLGRQYFFSSEHLHRLENIAKFARMHYETRIKSKSA